MASVAVCPFQVLPSRNNRTATFAAQSSKQSPSSPVSLPATTTAAAVDFFTLSHLQQLHTRLIKSGLPLSSSASALPLSRVAAVCALSSSSDFSYARRIFRLADSAASETILWNTHLSTLSASSPADALALFSRLRFAGIPADAFTLSFVLKACSRSSSALPLGRAVHALVEKLGLRCDVFLLNTLVHMYASQGDTISARLLFDVMPAKDVVTWNIMITHYTKTGEMDVAHQLFDMMPERSIRSWTAMIAGYVQWKNPRESLRLFRLMEMTGMQPNEVTVVGILAACADLGELDLGKRVHEFAKKCSFHENNVRVCNTLIDMYIKCGCVEMARRVFDEMAERTVVSWSAMIGGHAMHGQAEEALELFSKMKREARIEPNGVTFVGLLHACSHMGLLEEGKRFFRSMTEDYGIIPEIEHYGCMVDLLSRAGLLEEAREFIRKMPIKPNSVVWGALLGGAKVHKNIKIGEEAIQHLVELDPLNDGYYVVLSNIYADAEQWEDVANIRRMMKNRGLKKTPGWSTISLDGIVHEFVAGESDHPQIEEIYRMWDDLLDELRSQGYSPDTSAVLLDMDEREKEHVLYRHSEKLAVVFGLLSTPQRTPLRIMKNLRVCSDCHAALKLISEITNREIIVRDRNRFHCFRNGSCSCRDYW